VIGGLTEDQCAAMLRDFFMQRRARRRFVSNKEFHVTTTSTPGRGLVRIKSIRDVYEE